MKLTRSFTCGGVLALCLAALILAAGCASIEVAPKSQPVVSLTKPKQVLVYDFAVSPDEVRLQNGIDLRLKELVNQPSRTEQELAIGRQMAEALLKHLLVEVQSLGIPAVHATTNSIVNSETLLIKGQFISIAEGNQAGRMVIGLEMGSTEVRTLTQVYGVVQGEKRLLDEFDINGRNRRKPGVVKTLGAGVATG
ncbi:MAG TPA: DUF4410 domain-containing protein, partial [Candidatus Binatia bacterium]|nr:DUF4410 domain-containing protein [Candidatus Binatia bacterium]